MLDSPLSEEIHQLSVPEKLELIGVVWDSIEDCEEKIRLSDAQKDELDRRLESLSQSPEEGQTWEQVRAEISKPQE